MAFTPQRQLEICNNEQDCFFGDYPTLAQMNKTFGPRTAAVWMMPHISNLVQFIGGNMMSGAVQEELAYIIAQEYQYLKVTELMLFFQSFKRAAFGKLYGSLRTIDILGALHDFVMQRRANAKFEHIQRKEQEERERSYKEYLRNPAKPEDIERVLNKAKAIKLKML